MIKVPFWFREIGFNGRVISPISLLRYKYPTAGQLSIFQDILTEDNLCRTLLLLDIAAHPLRIIKNVIFRGGIQILEMN